MISVSAMQKNVEKNNDIAYLSLISEEKWIEEKTLEKVIPFFISLTFPLSLASFSDLRCLQGETLLFLRLPLSLSLCLSLLLLRLLISLYLSPLLLLFLHFSLLLIHLLLLSLSLSLLETLDSKEGFFLRLSWMDWSCACFFDSEEALTNLERKEEEGFGTSRLVLKRKSRHLAWTSQLSCPYELACRSTSLLFLLPSIN